MPNLDSDQPLSARPELPELLAELMRQNATFAENMVSVTRELAAVQADLLEIVDAMSRELAIVHELAPRDGHRADGLSRDRGRGTDGAARTQRRAHAID